MKIAYIPLSKGARTNTPTKIVIHAMGEFVEVEDSRHIHAYELLRNIGLSAHRLVTPNGDMIKCREDGQGSYHAKGHNTNSLGIEFLVPGAYDYDEFIEAIKMPYLTPEQFKNGVYIVKSWMIKWDINIDNVFTHSELDPDRKQDPGIGFPFREFINELKVS